MRRSQWGGQRWRCPAKKRNHASKSPKDTKMQLETHLPTTHTWITRRHTIIYRRRRCHHAMMILSLVLIQPHCVAIVMHYHWIILWCWIWFFERNTWDGRHIEKNTQETYLQTSLDYYYWPQMKLTVALIVALSVRFLVLHRSKHIYALVKSHL